MVLNIENIDFDVYTLYMDTEEKILKLRDEAIKALKGKMDDFALGGGTALSLVYFRHRDSYDLDFFTKEFSKKRIAEVISELSKSLGKEITLFAESGTKSEVKIIFYQVKGGLKIDFIEDVFRHFEMKNKFQDIPVLNKEAIYLRKVYASCGIRDLVSETGQRISVGGRQEAKDYFDLYYLSHVFMPLSDFAVEFCTPAEIERIIIWHSRYDRFKMKLHLLDLRTKQIIDAKAMERHFDKEIEKLIEKGMG